MTVNGTTATVTFSSTATDVARFECSLDTGAFATCTSPRVLTGLSEGSHTIRVRAIDQAGNIGTAAQSTFVIDTTAPAATIGNVTVSGTTARVTFSSEAGARFECSLDSGPFQACTSPREYTGLSAGSHTIRVRAIDQAGNVGVTAERSFLVDTSGPALLLGDVAVSGTTARVSFSSEAGARFECSLDGGTFETCTSPREYTGLTSGSHTIRVRAIDQAGNVGVAAERSFVVDTSAPAVTIGDVAVSGTTARVTFSSEAGARFECSLDNGPFVACTSPREYAGLTSGSHTVRVRAIDQAGNVGVAAERGFVIASPPPPEPTPDTTAPKVRPKPRSVHVSNKAGSRSACAARIMRSAVGS